MPENAEHLRLALLWNHLCVCVCVCLSVSVIGYLWGHNAIYTIENCWFCTKAESSSWFKFSDCELKSLLWSWFRVKLTLQEINASPCNGMSPKVTCDVCVCVCVFVLKHLSLHQCSIFTLFPSVSVAERRGDPVRCHALGPVRWRCLDRQEAALRLRPLPSRAVLHTPSTLLLNVTVALTFECLLVC